MVSMKESGVYFCIVLMLFSSVSSLTTEVSELVETEQFGSSNVTTFESNSPSMFEIDASTVMPNYFISTELAENGTISTWYSDSYSTLLKKRTKVVCEDWRRIVECGWLVVHLGIKLLRTLPMVLRVWPTRTFVIQNWLPSESPATIVFIGKPIK